MKTVYLLDDTAKEIADFLAEFSELLSFKAKDLSAECDSEAAGALHYKAGYVSGVAEYFKRQLEQAEKL